MDRRCLIHAGVCLIAGLVQVPIVVTMEWDTRLASVFAIGVCAFGFVVSLIMARLAFVADREARRE